MRTALQVLLFSFLTATGVYAQLTAPPYPDTVPLGARPPYAGWVALAKGPIPGFAGNATSFSLGADRSILNCILNVMVTDTAANAEAARKYFSRPDAERGGAPPECGRVTNIKVRQARYGILQLLSWFDAINKANRMQPMVRSPGAATEFMAKRIDVRQNQIQIASPNPALIARLRRIADSLAVPADAIEFSNEDVRSVIAGLGVLPPAPGPASTTYFEFQVDRAATALNGGMEKLVALARRGLGLSGETLVQFVVDQNGQVDRTTLKVLKTTDDRLSLFLRENLGNLQFTAAMRGGVAVRQLVQIKVQF